jgi:FMN phosphatase YigB (HAD superfamily)
VNTTPLYIFDLDGTLADLKHRRHFVQFQNGSPVLVNGTPAIYRGPNPSIEGDYFVEFPFNSSGFWSYDPSDIEFKPDWDAFHAACVDDTPIEAVLNVFHAIRERADAWIWSGRMDTVEEQTVTWLWKHGVIWANLKMRPAGDYTPDDQLKESWLHALSPKDRARLVMVFDDRQRVVDMWRRNGIVCAQVAPGDF